MKNRIQKTAGWLVMAAALAIGMTACTNDDNITDEPTTTGAPKTYTLSVTASKGDGATTRALSLSTDGKTLNATWKTGETVSVSNETPGRQADLGTLTAQSDGASTTLTGTLTGTIVEGDVLYLSIVRDGDWDKQQGTLEYISNHLDLANCIVHVASVDASNNITLTEGTAVFDNAMAVVRFHLLDKAGTPLNASALNINIPAVYDWEPSDYPLTGMTDATYTANAYGENTGAGVVYAAIGGFTGTRIVTLTATVGSDTYTYTKTGVTLQNGKFYDIKVKMKRVVSLAALTADYTAQDGDMLTGTLNGATQKYKISIAAGATVTLSNATINGVHTDDSHELWAGLTCEGDATIILDGTNAVENFNRHYPGLQPGPTGKTLTIRGSGSLTATCRNFGAGIGTKNDGGSCGNIRIEGGTVTANGGRGAGIGSGYKSSCGDITITGGTVTVTGAEDGAGIGSGNGNYATSQCGDITITGGTVTATGGESGAGIGSGYGFNGTSQCGAISISGSARVTANGGEKGAGIGTGQRGKSGSISISGGTVMAKGGNNATGIGTGEGDDEKKAECGAISISKGEGFVSVTAIRGSGATMSIGTRNGENNDFYKCGRITFGGIEIFNGGEDGNYSVPSDRTYNDLQFTKSTTDDDTNNTWTLKP